MSELSKLLDRVKAVADTADITFIDYHPIGIRHISDIHIGIEGEKEQKEQLSILFMKSRKLAKDLNVRFDPKARITNINQIAGATHSSDATNVRFKK